MGLLFSIYNGVDGSKNAAITKILATFINYYYNINLSVIDANPILPIFNERQHELKELESGNAHLLNEINKLMEKGKSLYPIYSSEIDNIEQIETYTKNHDITFINFPNETSNEDKRKIISMLDFIFIPFSTNEDIFYNQIETLDLATILSGEEKSRLKDFGVFIFSSFHENKTNYLTKIDAIFIERQLETMSKIYLENEEIYSTIVPIPYSEHSRGIIEFIGKMRNISSISLYKFEIIF